MSASNDILQLMPDIAAIGGEQLQAYCDEWIIPKSISPNAAIKIKEGLPQCKEFIYFGA